jgi:hypothetical protein
MSPREVVERWVERFNAADADGLTDLYHVDAVNHQVTQEPVKAATRSGPCSSGSLRLLT